MFANRKPAARRASIAVALAGACLCLFALPAHTQPAPYDREDAAGVGGVTVYAPHRYARQPTTGAWVRTDSISRVVSLDDLDLSTRYGARMAKARISRAARVVCQDVQNAYPNDVDPQTSCFTTALRDGLAQAQDIAGYPIVAWGYR